ncbi:histidine kinase [Flavisolibacter sp. BT320]|nr:histidine kinase [Flavisolibacter longurius]
MFRFFAILLCLFLLGSTKAQHTYNFHHLDASKGLADGVVRAIGQDKYGYIWIGTLSGLNRFDGYSVKTFYNQPEDSTSLPAATVRSIFCDKAGKLWIGCSRKLVQYNYATSRFMAVAGTEEVSILKMVQHTSGSLYLQTNKGLVRFNPASQQLEFLAQRKRGGDSLLGPFSDMFLKGDLLYLATQNGIVVYDCKSQQAKLLFTPSGPDKNVTLIAVDGQENIWFSTGDNTAITKTNGAFTGFQVYNQFSQTPSGFTGGSVYAFLVDNRGELWATTNFSGVIKFDQKKNTFQLFPPNPLDPSTVSAGPLNAIYQSKRGFLWVGSEGYGVNYFHPANNLFSVLHQPIALLNKTNVSWARSMAIDQKGAYWFGYGGLLLRQDPSTHQYSYYTNEQKKVQLHNASVRSVVADAENNIWIGTAGGMNRFTPQGKMQFLDERDSLPKTFIWKVFLDSRNIVWVGARDNIFYRDTVHRRFSSLNTHTVLKPFANKGARTIYEDRKKRLWFGGNGAGLLFYDPVTNTVKHWMRKEGGDTTIINNTINSIVEDRDGVIWCTSFTGLTSYNPGTGKFKWYTGRDGLPSIKLSGLKVDKRNNIWMGSTQGLLVFDSSRTNFRTFDVNDGLPTMEFADMDAFETPEGDFIYPTMKGFVRFNPDRYAAKKQVLDVLLSSLHISGRETHAVNAEALTSLNLKWDQNFFTLQLTAFNYDNPEQTWYAYKLDGFDKDWTYTKNRIVTYTNVTGGTYTFRYKATDDPNHWLVNEKTLAVSIGTVFYKAWWFWALVFSSAIGFAYWYYKNRLRQQRRIFLLQTKAQALEKEKALVMYEGLKQQLNPHFLFNSLTSLGSLIKVDPKLASQFLDGMSKIYRYILKSRDHEVVSLGEEVKFVAHYIRLQQTRFETGLQVNIAVPEDEYYKKIAPVTLQNLLENAIKHNIIDDESPLVIHIYIEDDYLVTRNNLQRKNFVETSNRQGLRNLTSLYRYLTRKPIVIEEDEQFYTIKIPLI